MKKILSPSTLIYPLPAIMVSVGSNDSEHNIITISWTGTICSDPPLCYISVRKSRHSYDIIKKNMDFVINLTTEALLHATDQCGIKSGKNTDKFTLCGLTKSPASIVKSPLITESPLNMECVVKEIKELGTHDMFIAEIVAVHADESIVGIHNAIDLSNIGLIAYNHKHYQKLGGNIGKYGFSAK